MITTININDNSNLLNNSDNYINNHIIQLIIECSNNLFKNIGLGFIILS